MSLREDKIVECPTCGRQFEAKVRLSVNVSREPHLKENVMQGKLNDLACPHCGSVVTSPYPFVYHDMEKKLMFCVLEEESSENAEALQRRVKTIAPETALYILQNLKQLRDVIEVLDSVDLGDCDSADLTPADWQSVVEHVLRPVYPWPLDHRCVCGETIKTVCYCVDEGMSIQMESFEPDLRPDFGIECSNCHRALVGFSCEKCGQGYQWSMGVAKHV